MSSTKVRHNANPYLDILNPPDGDRLVAWNSASGEFELIVSKSIDVVVVDELASPDQSTYYVAFSRTNDGSETGLSGSDDVTYHRTNGGVGRAEFRIQSSSYTKALASYVPLRIEKEVTDGDAVSSYEYLAEFTKDNTNYGDTTLTTLRTPKFDHYGDNGCLTGSFSILKIEHTAFVTGSNPISQFMTHHMSWTKDANNNAASLVNVTIESARIPSNKSIIDPTSVTGSFTSDGNIELEAYHYGTKAQHRFKYIAL